MSRHYTGYTTDRSIGDNGGHCYYRSWVDDATVSSTETQTTITVKVGYDAKGSKSDKYPGMWTVYLDDGTFPDSGAMYVEYDHDFYKTLSTSWTTMVTKTYTLKVNHTTAAQTKRFGTWRSENESPTTTPEYTRISVTVPARNRYTVTFNDNDDTSHPVSSSTAAMTNYYGYAITLPTPVRTGYTFSGWLINGTLYKGGVSFTVTSSVTAVAQWKSNYTTPVLKITKAIRTDSDGTENDEGAYFTVTFNWSTCTAAGWNTTSLAKTCTLTYKERGSNVGTTKNISVTGSSKTGQVTAAYGPIEESITYDLTLSLNDTYSSVSATDVISPAFFLIDFLGTGEHAGKGLAFGGPATDAGVHVKNMPFEIEDGTFKLNGKSFLDLTYPVGAIYISVNSTSPATLFGGTWERIQDRFLLAAGSSYAAGETGGEATHKLTVAEMPSHTHVQNQHRHGMGEIWSDGSGSTTAYTFSSNRVRMTRNTAYATPTNQNTGGNGAHNNMPPYLSVYVWKRTA